MGHIVRSQLLFKFSTFEQGVKAEILIKSGSFFVILAQKICYKNAVFSPC